MVLISPDTAVIDNALNTYIDTTVEEAVNGYYILAEQMKDLFNSKEYNKRSSTEEQSKEMHQAVNTIYNNAKRYKDNIKQFRYYQALAIHAALIFQIYFNQSFPLSTFQIIDKPKLNISNLKHVADSLKADYVIGYKDIHTENKAGAITMSMKTLLFSRKENKILLSAKTTGDQTNHGDIWSCSNPLSCLLLTTLRPSIDKVAAIIAQRQQD